MTRHFSYPPEPGAMTREEHIREAELCLYRAMSRGTDEKAQHAIAEATIGLLHVALANAKPITVTPKPPVQDTGWLKLEER